MNPTEAGEIVSKSVVAQAPENRVAFLRDVLAFAAAGLVVIEGREAAAEACYRTGDAVVERGAP